MYFIQRVLLAAGIVLLFQYSYAQCGLDVFIANDQSGSVDALENAQGRHFISELMLNLDPWGTANNQSRMAVAQWDDRGTWTQYSFPTAGQNYTTQLIDVLAFQNSPRILYGDTDPYSALLKTYNAINQTPVAGRTSDQIIILMTDAYCDQIQGDIVNLATQIKDNGIYVMVLAIDGAQNCTVLQGENVASAGGYFSAQSYAELEQKAISYVRNIISAACIGPPPPSFDLTMNLNNFTATNCVNGNGTYKVDYSINNIGKVAWNNNVTISFYNGDPTLPTTQLVAVQNTGNQAIAVNGSINGSFTSNLLGSATKLYAIVNFNGSLPTNAPPLPYNLKDKLIITGERNEKNNLSKGVSRMNDISCKPKAVLNVDVQAGGIGCDNTVTYEVEICNTGDATAVVDNIIPIVSAGFVLKNASNVIIDSVLTRVWASYYGDSEYELFSSVKTDRQNNVYILGTTESSSGIATAGSYQPVFGGNNDIFIVKFNKEGVRQWATYYGGAGFEFAYDMEIDSLGNIYIVGETNSVNSISTSGTHQTINDGDYDGFLVKFNSAGVRQWATYYGGTNFDAAQAVFLDTQNNIYISGTTGSANNISTAGAFQTNYIGRNNDAFLVKFNSTGVRQWGTYYGGLGVEVPSGLSVDGQNNVYMIGSTDSDTGISTAGAYQTTRGGANDAFIVKFNTAGVRQWATYYGGTAIEGVVSIITDEQDNIYITGRTESANNIASAGAHQGVIGGNIDAYLAKFNSTGSRQWATYYGGSGDDYGLSVVKDALGRIYMAGSTNSITSIASADAYQPAIGGANDIYMARFSNIGVRQWATYYGGTVDDIQGRISIDQEGSIYLAGSTESLNNIATTPSFQDTYNANRDAFLVKLMLSNQLKINPNECLKRQYTYTYSGVAPGTYNYSVGITASKNDSADATLIILPDSNFNAGTFSNIDGFNGAIHTSDNVTITGNTAACATGDKVNVSVSIPAVSGCGGGNYVQATITINNTSGVAMFNPKLYLNLSGTGATFAGELYNLTNNLSIPAPNILAPAYPNVANALYAKTGVQTLPIYQLPAGTSTFKIDINLGSALTNLGVRVDSLPAIFNASGSSNLATDAQGVSIPALPNISGFSCPAAISVGGTITFSGISTLNAASVKWTSSSVANIPNGGSTPNPSITYTPTPTDLANGFVAISLTALNSAGCDATRSCQVAINNVLHDYGDAPIAYDLNRDEIPYAGSSTLLTGVHLGTTAPSTEPTAKNSADAKGDGVEEDGLPSSNCTSKPINLQTFPLIVKATNTTSSKAYVSAFADWNNDGDYLDDGETSLRIVTVPNGSGTQNYTLNFIPETANVSLSQYFVRLRISTDSNSIKQPYEPSPQGEIEDHIMKLGLSATYKQFTFDICQGDSVKVNNKTYKITGTYFDTLVNSVGCDSIITTKLTVHPKYNKTQVVNLCQGENIKVGINTYTQTGTYTDSLKTTKNCDSVIITDLTVRPKYALSQNVSICRGNSYTIGIHIYTQPGIYKDTLKTTLSCDSVVTTNLSYSPLITSLQNITICPNGSYTIGTHTYTQAGTYKDTLQTVLSCDSVVTTTISVAALQTVSRSVSICSNEKLVIGNHTYTTSGVYKDTIRGNAGCDTLLTTSLSVYPKPVVDLGNNISVCPDSVIVLDARNSGANFLWNTTQTTQQISAVNAGTYIVIVTKDICSTNDTIIIQHKPVYKVDLGLDVTLCNKDTLVLNVTTAGGSYIWQDGSVLPVFLVRDSGVYYVKVTTECAVSSDTINVGHQECDCQYYIPSAFSPNNDGVNDVFGPVNQCTGVSFYKLEVYNRWGEQVFQSGNENDKWNGIYKGAMQALDDYVYILTYRQNNKDYYQKGTFSLLR
ncbi:MAG: SBBP repeat-containing protein [Chitinophagales bacterium]|nr:SBBP repeat-containing protein [Chitinophagales bacterium]